MKYFLYSLFFILSSCNGQSNAVENIEADSVATPLDSIFISKTPKFENKKVEYISITDSAASLSAINSYEKNGKSIRITLQGFFYIDSILTIDTISRKQFYSVSKDKSIINQKNVYKKDSTLYLPQLGTSNQLKLRDKFAYSRECADKIYSYYGTIPYLQSYIIGSFDCDLYMYNLLDQRTGEIGYRLAGYPIASPQKQKIASLGTTQFNNSSTLMQIDKIEGNTLHPLYYFEFIYWIPFGEKVDIRWLNENTFFIKVIPSEYLGMPEEKNEKLAFYIKVEINE